MYKTVISFLLISLCTLSNVFSQEIDKNHKPPLTKGAIGKHSSTNYLDKKLHKKCIYPTVKVTDASGEQGGSGFIVRSCKVGKQWHNIVIGTAHTVHCELCQPEELFVHVPTYEKWSIVKEYNKYHLTIYARNDKMDMSVGMFITDERMPTVDMCFDTTLYIGTEVFHMGYAILDDARIDYGQVTSPKITSPEYFKGFIRTNVHTFMGDSGGPLFLKDNYKVVGIARGIRSYRGRLIPNISYYCPITDLKTWDAELNNALESVYNEKAAMPVIPFARLKLKGFEITE